MYTSIEFTRRHYNEDVNVKRYGEAIDKVGLWQSEELFFEKYILKDNKILDLGCGAGRTTINLFKNGYKNIVGIDLAENMIEYAKDYCKTNKLNISFEVGDATNLKYENESFDAVIFSYNGMQCIPGKKNRDAVLREVFRVLKSGGIFIFTAHDRDDSGEYKKVWDEEKVKWDNGTQDKNLEIFGDRLTKDQNGETVFVHFSNIPEMIQFIEQQKFKIMEHTKSIDIAEENEKVKSFAGETVFGACQKL